MISVDLGDILASYWGIFGASASILTIFDSKFGLFRPLEDRVNVKNPLDVILYRLIKLSYPWIIILMYQGEFLISY